MTYLFIIILILIVIEYLIIKDFNKLLKLISILTIISGNLTIIISFIVKLVINQKLNFINISKITTPITNQIIEKGLILILIGALEIIIYIVIIIFNKYKKKNY